MSPTSIQTNPHNIRLWPFCLFNLVLQGLLCHLISFHGQNTMLVVLVVVLSRAALGATLVPTPARSPATPFSAIRSFYGHRCNQRARRPWFSRCRGLDNMYSKLISVLNTVQDTKWAGTQSRPLFLTKNTKKLLYRNKKNFLTLAYLII